jgi:hypothetical protein
VGLGADLEGHEKSHPTGVLSRTSPVRSKSLHRLCYPGRTNIFLFDFHKIRRKLKIEPNPHSFAKEKHKSKPSLENTRQAHYVSTFRHTEYKLRISALGMTLDL